MKSADLILLSLILGAKVLAAVDTNSGTAGVILSWKYPTNAITDDLTFQIYGTKDLTVPWTNWGILTNVLATNYSPFQVTFDGTNWMATNLFVRLDLQPDRYFFVLTASNFWGGTSITSSMAMTPPAPLVINNSLRIQRAP